MLLALTSSALVNALIYLVVAGLILYVCWWGLAQIGLPEPFNKIARVILVLVTVVLLINFLMGFTSGGGFISWE